MSSIMNTAVLNNSTPLHRNFRGKLTDFFKRVNVLGSVVGEAKKAFPNSGYDQIEKSVSDSVDSVTVSKARSPWKRWFDHVSRAFKESAGSRLFAEEKFYAANADANRLGGQIGARLEQETTKPEVADRLVSKLADAGLYRQGRGAQLNLLQGEPSITLDSVSQDSSFVQKATIGSTAYRLEAMVTEVTRLTKKLDSLLYMDPATRNEACGVLNHNDAQLAFHYRDSLDGLIKSYGALKKDVGTIPNELQTLLQENKEDLARACAYAGWSNDLRAALRLKSREEEIEEKNKSTSAQIAPNTVQTN